MRFRIAVLAAATVALLATTAAFGASATTVKRTMRGTTHFGSGGKLSMKVKRISAGTRFQVNVGLKIPVKAATQLTLTAYPCGSATCDASSRERVKISGKPGVHGVTYEAKIPRIEGETKPACVFLQLVDIGPKRNQHKIVLTRKGKQGLRFCEAP
jgi:hypothetical protein